MEADWSVALGADDPVIVVPWAAAPCRFIDLRVALQDIDEIAEAKANPPIRSALLRLNAPGLHLWTAKCDAWRTGPDQADAPLDPYEMDAEPGATAFGAGCYLDVLFRGLEHFTSLELHKQWMFSVIDRLRVTPAFAARVDLVLRPADVDETAGFGMTCFVEGCGASGDAAHQRWAEALGLSLAVLMDTPCPTVLPDDTMAKRASSSIG